MTNQLELDMQPLVIPDRVEGATIQERFESFHALNPWVLEQLETLIRDELAHGFKKTGIKALFEQIRWHYRRATNGDRFRLNNDYPSRYVRLIVERHPDWADMFETRELRTE